MGHRIYKISPLAKIDLEEIWIYTMKQWSMKQADKYICTILAAFENLASGKSIGTSTHVRAGYYKYTVGAHVIYYQDNASTVAIIRILHRRMDVESHL